MCYDGIRFAVDRFAADPEQRVNVTIVPFDTERDPAIAARGVKTLAADEKLVGIIGPDLLQFDGRCRTCRRRGGCPVDHADCECQRHRGNGAEHLSGESGL